MPYRTCPYCGAHLDRNGEKCDCRLPKCKGCGTPLGENDVICIVCGMPILRSAVKLHVHPQGERAKRLRAGAYRAVSQAGAGSFTGDSSTTTKNRPPP